MLPTLATCRKEANMAETLKNPKIDPYKGIVKNGRIVAPKNTIIRLPVDMIRPDPKQVRQNIDADELNDLIESVKLVGQLEPIDILLRDGGKWAIIDDGERRWRTIKALNLPSIRCIIVTEEYAALRKFSPETQKLIRGSIANICRPEMAIVDKAEALQKIIADTGWTALVAGRVLGMKPGTTYETLKILRLIPAIREKLVTKQITPREALAVAPWPPEKQLGQLDVIRRLKESLGKSPKPEDLHLALKKAGEDGGFSPRPGTCKGRRVLTPVEMIMRSVLRNSLALTASLKELSKRPENILAAQKKPGYYDLFEVMKEVEKHLAPEIKRASDHH